MQENLRNIEDWTERKKMKLNTKKSCGMVFNFTNNYQFTSRLTLDGGPLKLVEETKLLGVILTNDLKWSKNTDFLIKRANARMEILRKLSSFNAPIKDMILTYFLYIRSILEQSSVIWHSTLTEEDNVNLERVQKNALRNILKDKYENYENARKILKIETLYERRETLLKNFGKKCLKLEQTRELFPLNEINHTMQTRNKEKYKIVHANTDRLKNSTVPYIQRMLNNEEKQS